MSPDFSVDNWSYASFPLTPSSSTSCTNYPAQPWNETPVMMAPQIAGEYMSLEFYDQRSSPTSESGPCMNDLNFFSQTNQIASINQCVGPEALWTDWARDFGTEKTSAYLNTDESQLSVFENLISGSQPAQLNSSLCVPYPISDIKYYGLATNSLDGSVASNQEPVSMQSGFLGKYPDYPSVIDSLELNSRQVSFQSSTLERIRSEQEQDQEDSEKRSENQGENCVRFIPGNTVYLPCSGKKCDFEGCGKKFVRQEHLKRHQRTHYNFDRFDCPFCKRAFSRSDNLKAHIKLHGTGGPDRPNRRTQYYKEAAPMIERLSRKRQKKLTLKRSTTVEKKPKEK